MDNNRPFPIQGDSEGDPCSIPWWLAEEAYKTYCEWYGNRQSLERIAQRGGFGRIELLMLLRKEKI